MNLISNDELQRWIEAFSCCTNLIIDDSCCGLISPSGPQKIDVDNVHSLVSYISPVKC